MQLCRSYPQGGQTSGMRGSDAPEYTIHQHPPFRHIPALVGKYGVQWGKRRGEGLEQPGCKIGPHPESLQQEAQPFAHRLCAEAVEVPGQFLCVEFIAGFEQGLGDFLDAAGIARLIQAVDQGFFRIADRYLVEIVDPDRLIPEKMPLVVVNELKGNVAHADTGRLHLPVDDHLLAHRRLGGKPVD
jgi:hypothetical protein